MIWFVDNSVTVAALVKGRSGSSHIDAAVMSIHLALGLRRSRAWWEYIESESNWTDEASRKLEKGSWAHEWFLDRACAHTLVALDPSGWRTPGEGEVRSCIAAVGELAAVGLGALVRSRRTC
jgi:hypothetical protein